MEEERLSPVDRVGPGCAHWIHPKYQVCVPDNNVTKTTELVLRTGKVFKYTGEILNNFCDVLRLLIRPI